RGGPGRGGSLNAHRALNDRDTGAEAAVHFSKLEAREPHAHRCLQPARRHVYFDRLKRARPQVQGIVTATRGNQANRWLLPERTPALPIRL
ncbi:MAG: hypothetical protein WBC72_19210, partial [Pseudolabrys sp.]